MAKKSTDAQQRAEYKEIQRRKKRHIEAGKQRAGGFDNPAKAVNPHNRVGIKTPKGSGNKQQSNRVSKKVGEVLCGIQALASMVFMAVLFMLGMLPMKFMVIIGVVLVVLLVITAVIQLRSKKNAIGGKVFSVIITLLLIFGSYYVAKANGAIDKISGGKFKVDNMVVAVLANDPAEKIKDARDYSYGVQYAMGGKDMESAVADISKEVGADINVTEYESLKEQAEALHDGSVQAIIYNEGYTGILQESFEGYSDNVKIIYQHSIKKELDDTASKVSVKDDTFSVFISGIDVYGPIETNSRSDVNIIATINPTTHQVLLTTTPRDYYVEIPGITGGGKDKLTHAGIYGVDASMNSLKKLYDTEIDFYARVNFTSLVEIVDVLGGIDVNSEHTFTTSEDSGLVMNVQEGLNNFNGNQALAFSRERQNVPGGDNQRGKNQQAVITAMIKKMLSPAMLINASGVINSVSGNVETNMSQEQIQALVKQQLSNGKAWNIKSMAADGTADSQYCYSYAEMPLYVTTPIQESVDAVKSAIEAVEAGEVLEDSEVAQ